MSRRTLEDYMPLAGHQLYGSELVTLIDPAAEAIYVRLLWVQWCNGSLPAEPNDIRALLPVKFHRPFAKAWARLEPKFPLVGLRRENPICAAERLDAIARIKGRKVASDAANDVRWEEHRRAKQEAANRATGDPNGHPNGSPSRSPTGHPNGATTGLPGSGSGSESEESSLRSDPAAAPPGRPRRAPPPPPNPRPKPKPQRAPEHAWVVAMFQRAWAACRHREKLAELGLSITPETPLDAIPRFALYPPKGIDWKKAESIWRTAGGDKALILARMRNLFESTADWAGQYCSLAVLDSKWPQLEQPLHELVTSNGRGAP